MRGIMHYVISAEGGREGGRERDDMKVTVCKIGKA